MSVWSIVLLIVAATAGVLAVNLLLECLYGLFVSRKG